MLSIKEAAAFLGLPTHRIYGLDKYLEPIYQDRGPNQKMKTRYYVLDKLKLAKPIIDSLNIKEDITHRSRVSGKRTYRKRYQTQEEQDYKAMRCFWNNHIHGCKAREYENDLTYDMFEQLVLQNCDYCGQEPIIRQFNKYYLKVNGIDRVDSNKGYKADNVVPCCKICNRMKNSLNRKLFLRHLNKICTHQKDSRPNLTRHPNSI